ncbi:alkaline phosphatase family protein [Leptospira ognonensis]|uniref:Alkaline phosphatase family protein n=1 Tax=Leptospira ognonensis TaxID=2484945 RepID=A0A4R9K2R9_9LEPT|nr:alkaline phosphatase family protein [Leptospira ognonensis]TGL59160.1 alkaline phosphatase family protein [Leptospira ognonensis]
MKRFWHRLSEFDRLFLTYLASFLTLFSVFRVLFFLLYSYRIVQFDWLTICFTFAIGIRYDLATSAMILGLPYVLSKMSFLNRYYAFRLVWSFLPILLFIWSFGHLTSDLLYYENANKHIGYEAIIFFADLPLLIKSALMESPYSMSAILLGFACLMIVLFTLYFKYKILNRTDNTSLLRNIAKGLVGSILIILAIRGGVQQTPLRASNAIVGEDTFTNNIALNGIYTTVMDLKSQSIPQIHKMGTYEATQIFQKETGYEGAEFIGGEEFPLLRRQMETNDGKFPNIVLIFQESWTGKFVWPISNGIIHGKELTPYYNQLARRGHSFKNFYANGGRTSNGLMSVLTGIPDRPGLTAVRSHQILGNFSGLGTVFQKWGYDTIFITGDDLQFDNLGKIIPHWGFKNLIGKKEIANSGKYKIGAWGYDDEDIFSILHEQMNDSYLKGKPFLGTALTMTTHYPYKVPDKKYEIFDPSIQDYDYLNTYHYSDAALKDFITKIETEPYFKDTIFVFVADHTHHRYLSYYEDRNVPFLIYSPSKIKAKLDDTISSQLDVFPTILGLVGKETTFSAMGRNLLAKNLGPGKAYFAYGAAYGWIEGNQFVYQWVDGEKSLHFTANPPYTEHKECNLSKEVCASSLLKAKSFFNLSIDLMNQNKIFPGETSDADSK